MLTLLNLLLLMEVILILWLAISHRVTMMTHWRTSSAAVFVLTIVLLVNGMYLAHTGCLHDTVQNVFMLAVVIGFLLSSDSHATAQAKEAVEAASKSSADKVSVK